MKGDVVLMSADRYHRRIDLPLREIEWHPDTPVKAAAVITMPGFRKGQKPPNAGRKFPADPPTPDECVRLLDACGGGKTGKRNRALLAIMWRSGLRVSEALALQPHHVDFENSTITVLCGKGGKRGTAGIDPWGLDQIRPWLEHRAKLGVPAGAPLICCVSEGSVGQPVHSAYVRALMKRLGRRAGIPKRLAPHQLRHAHACDLAREGVAVHLISRQLRHSNLGVTATYLQGIAPFEVVNAIAVRPAPLELAA